MFRYPLTALLMILMAVSCMGDSLLTVPGLETQLEIMQETQRKTRNKKTARALLQIASGLAVGTAVIVDAAKSKKDAKKAFPEDFLTEGQEEDLVKDIDSWRPIHTAGLFTAGGFVLSGALTFPIHPRPKKKSKTPDPINPKEKGLKTPDPISPGEKELKTLDPISPKEKIGIISGLIFSGGVLSLLIVMVGQ